MVYRMVRFPGCCMSMFMRVCVYLCMCVCLYVCCITFFYEYSFGSLALALGLTLAESPFSIILLILCNLTERNLEEKEAMHSGWMN